MSQISLKLKIYAKNASNASIINNDIERVMLRFILCSFGALALLYVFLLGNTVRDIVGRRGLEVNARTLSNEVRNLELTYLSMSNNIDLTLSYSMGFKETKPTFATRKSLGYRPTGVPLDSVKTLQNDL